MHYTWLPYSCCSCYFTYQKVVSKGSAKLFLCGGESRDGFVFSKSKTLSKDRNLYNFNSILRNSLCNAMRNIISGNHQTSLTAHDQSYQKTLSRLIYRMYKMAD